MKSLSSYLKREPPELPLPAQLDGPPLHRHRRHLLVHPHLLFGNFHEILLFLLILLILLFLLILLDQFLIEEFSLQLK